MKRLLPAVLLGFALLFCTGCKEMVTVHCDRCGTELTTTRQDITEDWILFCKDCEEEIGPIVAAE